MGSDSVKLTLPYRHIPMDLEAKNTLYTAVRRKVCLRVHADGWKVEKLAIVL